MPRPSESKLVALDEVSHLAQSLAGKRVVSTNGCFDILHWGHITYLNEARALGDILVVGVNSDISVKRIKGDSRPLFPEKVRALQLAALEAVDYVVIFPESTPERFLTLLKPAIHVKGGDYKEKPLPERAIVEAHGGKVICLSLVDGYSTTEIIRKLEG